MKKIYIETTVVSYFSGRATRDLVIAAHQEETRRLWPRLESDFETYISALVYEEARRGDAGAAKRRLVKAMMIRQVVENAGYQCPEICSPEELMEATP